jgi:hypothetical protein
MGFQPVIAPGLKRNSNWLEIATGQVGQLTRTEQNAGSSQQDLPAYK